MAEQTLLDAVKKDDRYKKYRNTLKTIRGRLKLEDDMNEVLGLHASRTSRSLYGDKQYKADAIVSATAQDLSIRSRMVEIRQRTAVQLSLLEGSIGRLHKYLRIEYKSYLRQYSNEANRRAALDAVTESGQELITEGETLVSTIDQLVKDLDQSGHSIRHMVEILKLLSEGKGKVV